MRKLNEYFGRNYFVKLYSCFHICTSSKYLTNESFVALPINGRINEEAYRIRERFHALSERKDERRPESKGKKERRKKMERRKRLPPDRVWTAS